MFGQTQYTESLDFFQPMTDDDRFCTLDQDFCFLEPTPININFVGLDATTGDTHSDHTREEESIPDLHLSSKKISLDVQPDESDILAAFEEQPAEVADPRSAICTNPKHKECQAFRARAFGTLERSNRGRKAMTVTAESEDLSSMISKKLSKLDKRRDNSNQTLIGLIKHSLKLILKNRPKQPKTKEYDIAQSLISQIGNRGDQFCIESALESLETKTGKTKKKDQYAQPSFAGLVALSEKNPFLRDWISFLLKDVQSRRSADTNTQEFESILNKINLRLSQ